MGDWHEQDGNADKPFPTLAKVERDIRTPREILDAIATHGRTVATAWERLRALSV